MRSRHRLRLVTQGALGLVSAVVSRPAREPPRLPLLACAGGANRRRFGCGKVGLAACCSVARLVFFGVDLVRGALLLFPQSSDVATRRGRRQSPCLRLPPSVIQRQTVTLEDP